MSRLSRFLSENLWIIFFLFLFLLLTLLFLAGALFSFVYCYLGGINHEDLLPGAWYILAAGIGLLVICFFIMKYLKNEW